MQSSNGEPCVNPRSAKTREAITRRAKAYTARAAEAEFQRRLARWATDDLAPFPSREQAFEHIRCETETLASALGVWSAVDPDEIFGPDCSWDSFP